MFIEMCDLMNWLVKSLLLTYERRGSQRSLPITGSFFAVLEEGEKIRAVKCRVRLSPPLVWVGGGGRSQNKALLG